MVENSKTRQIIQASEQLDLAANELKRLSELHKIAAEFYKAQHQLMLSRISRDCVEEFNKLYGETAKGDVPYATLAYRKGRE